MTPDAWTVAIVLAIVMFGVGFALRHYLGD